MIDKNSKERRSHVRGDLSFKVKFEVIPPEEYKKVKGTEDHILCPDKETVIDVNHTDKGGTGITTNSSMIDFILHMDEKLDRILAVVSKDRVEGELLNQGAGLNISGAGMKMIVDKPVEPGQIIHTNFVLSRIPLVLIDVLGEVAWVTPVDEDGKTVYHLGIRFLNLTSNDKERIIACVFQRQRENIRKMRNERYDDKGS